MSRSLAGIFVAFFLVAGMAACQSGPGVVLKVGDCLNYVNTAEGENTVVVDCAQPHAEEAFSVFDVPDSSEGSFPGYEAIGAVSQTSCQADFEDYVGFPWEQSVYSIGYTGPTETSWAAGDRSIICLLEDSTGAQLTGSARGTAR
jgi:hypothetical protein